MRHTLIAAAAAIFLFINIAGARAAEITATITHIDVNARIIVIDHRAFHVPTTIKIGILKVGQQVTVVYEVVDGQLKIVSVRID
jgi:Cu/Ag efflux protein CusF